MKRFGLPRQARLRRARDFDHVNAAGRRLIVHPLRVRALRRPAGQSRLGLAVSRRVGRAHVRNRWKRAIREAFRLNRHRLPRAYDLVVSVAWDAAPGEIAAVQGAFLQIVERLNADDGQADGAAADS